MSFKALPSGSRVPKKWAASQGGHWLRCRAGQAQSRIHLPWVAFLNLGGAQLTVDPLSPVCSGVRVRGLCVSPDLDK